MEIDASGPARGDGAVCKELPCAFILAFFLPLCPSHHLSRQNLSRYRTLCHSFEIGLKITPAARTRLSPRLQNEPPKEFLIMARREGASETICEV